MNADDLEQMEGVKAMELFGRELSLEQMIGLVECQATPDEDLVHRAALEIIAALRESQRRERAAVEDLRRNRKYKCDCCHYAEKRGRYVPCRDCQSPISNCGDAWKWRGPQEEEGDTE